VIASLASGAGNEEAARIGRVHANTVANWMQVPRFRQLVEEARTVLLDRLIGTVSSLGVRHLTNLDQIAMNPEVPWAVRRLASKDIVDALIRLREHGTISSRLDSLEEALASGPRSTLLPPHPVGGSRDE
jgi:hypothetical protein